MWDRLSAHFHFLYTVMLYYLQQTNITFEVRKKLIYGLDLNLKPVNWKIIHVLATYNFPDSRLRFSESHRDERVCKTWGHSQSRVWDKVQMDKCRNISLAFLSRPVCLGVKWRIWRWHRGRCSFKAEHKLTVPWLTKLEGRQDFKSLWCILFVSAHNLYLQIDVFKFLLSAP